MKKSEVTYDEFMEHRAKTIVVNLFGGPGGRKSTTMGDLYSKLRWDGIMSEKVSEYAKAKVWEESFTVLDDQVYVFSKQYHALATVCGKVQVAVTDSPIILSLVYMQHEVPSFENMVLESFNTFTNLNIFLNRRDTYDHMGRMQTKEEAEKLDRKIQEMLDINDIPYHVLDAGPETTAIIKEMVKIKLTELKSAENLVKHIPNATDRKIANSGMQELLNIMHDSGWTIFCKGNNVSDEDEGN